MNVVTVTINGVEYKLKGNEDIKYLKEIADHVDNRIRYILKSNEKLDTCSASVLTALNSMDEMMKMEIDIENYKKKIKEAEEKETLKDKEIKELNKNLKLLQGYNDELLNRLENDKKETEIKEKSEEIKKLKEQVSILEKQSKEALTTVKDYKAVNKELKFSLQSERYKVLDLDQKLMESNLLLAKERSEKAPYLKHSMKKD